MSSPLIAPSLLSADFAHLADEVREVEKAGADWLHLDIMDGHFVPNITIGPILVQALRPLTRLPLDCHLMVSEPGKWIEPFAKAGADFITVHAEAARNLPALFTRIRKLGCKVGVSINPGTPPATIWRILPKVDLVLVMSVHPGFGGQKFIESSLKKIQQLAALRASAKLNFLIEVDGGVNASNIGSLKRAGVDVFVAGNAVFGEKNRAKAMKQLRKELTQRKAR
ncbi:MAG: ribulose-phosphate 3-epimerase [Bdellovibrionales bacterium GWC1_52_8]|nr:MAG: ribulose-phosphate 3-epimerase [Bdellovibrionales bacterium GWB1_52_6]OFZ04328.1 MAG: ribulose-phosphate 3-epimerase [Bdellovibrionales bacterium GWA1_52_35]OFZ39245.1 MAG: ribulose-phosphate 3-epimerase [Bdellovibrionales bacterium GWC1_52_8]HCM40820.1 ribulose-phosphate 3-epimerase [Bdellovibrionales bacterium]